MEKDYKNISNGHDLYNFILKYYRDWVCFTSKEFSKDYPSCEALRDSIILQTNNQFSNTPITKKLIIGVNELPTKENKTLSNLVDLLFTNGYYVQHTTNVQPCTHCGLALPTYEAYKKLVGVKPNNWSSKCSTC